MALNQIPGAFASLSSGLLARKGAAKPAMRPQGFGQMGASLEDLGWNDMGFEPPKPTVSIQERDDEHDAFGAEHAEQPLRNPVGQLTPLPVHGQQAEIAQRFGQQFEALNDFAGQDREEAEDDVEDFSTLVAALVAAPLDQAQPVPTLSIKARVLAGPAPDFERVEPVDQAVVRVQPVRIPKVRTANGSGPKAAFTLRLDAARHLKLRLACALTRRSAQAVVLEAVDRLLETYPELDTIAGQLPDRSPSARAQGRPA